MPVTVLDPFDDVLMARMYDVAVAAKSVERPYFVPVALPAVLAAIRHADPGERETIIGTWEGGLLVGVATVWEFLLDNVSTAYAQVEVHPDHRRRGHGSALVNAVCAMLCDRGRDRLIVETVTPTGSGPDHPHHRFALHHGFVPGEPAVVRRLALPVRPGLLERLTTEARSAYGSRYAVQTFDVVPDPLRASLCECMNRVDADAPSGEIEWEPESLDPSRYAGQLALDAQMARTRLTALATDTGSGDVVAFTELFLPQAPHPYAHQAGTLVLEAHRGHGLGLAVKAANLAELGRRFPERTAVFTGNAVANPWMVAVNDRLGFVPFEAETPYVRSVGLGIR